MKKVLIITYYWPPAGGPGVQRVLKFAKYLPQFGWQPVILTVKNGDYPAIDHSLAKDVAPDLKVVKTKTLEPFTVFKLITGRKKEDKIPTYILNEDKTQGKFTKLAKWVRANYFIPDARVGWKRFAIKAGMKIIKDEKIDLIFSSSPPQTVQLIGRELSEQTNTKWVADFRDPWTDAFWIKDLKRTESSWEKDRNMEASVLKSADMICTVSQNLVELFESKQANRYKVLPNGFDTDDFQKGTGAPTPENSEKLTITYVGYADTTQKATEFFKAVQGLSGEYSQKLHIEFYGKTHPDILALVKELNIESRVHFMGYIPHSKAVEKIMGSDVLLLLIPQIKDNKGILTGKLFEYLATGNFILGFGPKDGDSAKILNATKSGTMYEYDESLTNVLESMIDKKVKGESLSQPNEEVVQQYSRRNLTKQLSEYFDEVINE